MKKKLPKHLSYDYQLKLDDTPLKIADRMPLKVIMPAIVIGFIMTFISCLELSGSMYAPESMGYVITSETRPPLFSHTVVDTAFIILGLGIIIGAVVSYIRYKKIFFNGKIFSVDLHGIFTESELFREFLRNYNGVRFRAEFFQFGILNKNKYIIELEHRDPQKTIPLYISTNPTDIYQIWYYYAKKLSMPAILDTDEGTIIKEINEIDKNLKEYLSSRNLISVYDNIPQKSQNINLIEKKDRIIIKPRRLFWSIPKLLGVFWLTFYLIILFIAAFYYEYTARFIGSTPKTIFAFCFLVLLAVFFIGLMFKKDKLVIKNGRLILVNKIFFISYKEYAHLDDIRDIQVVYNPTADRYYLAVITDKNMLAFGKAMPLEDLQWIRDYLIFKILH